MIGRLLALGLTQIDQYTLTKESLELVEKEYAEVNHRFSRDFKRQFSLQI